MMAGGGTAPPTTLLGAVAAALRLRRRGWLRNGRSEGDGCCDDGGRWNGGRGGRDRCRWGGDDGRRGNRPRHGGTKLGSRRGLRRGRRLRRGWRGRRGRRRGCCGLLL